MSFSKFWKIGKFPNHFPIFGKMIFQILEKKLETFQFSNSWKKQMNETRRFKEIRILGFFVNCTWIRTFVLHYIEKYLFICPRFISEPTRTDKSFGFRLWLGFRLGTWTGYLGLYLQSVYFGGSSFWGLVLDRQRVAKTPSSSLSSRVYLPRMWRSNSSKRLLLLKSLSWEIVVSSSKWPFDSRYGVLRLA